VGKNNDISYHYENKKIEMKNKIWPLFVFLSVLSVTSLQNCSKDPIEPPPIEPPPQWSEPVLYYSNPDAYTLVRFAADANSGTLNVVSSFDLFSKGMNYSGIYSLRQEPGKELVKKRLSQENIPSEWPSILRDHSGDLHFLWGDRSQDPEFENWSSGREKGIVYSTDVIYFNCDKDRPEHIYTGNLLGDGTGNIFFPLHLAEDNQENLHGVIHVERLLSDADGNPTEFGTFWLVYVNKSKNGQWTSRFLHGGGGPGLVSLAGNRLVIAYRGVDLINPTPGNNLFTTYSDDGGVSWSDPVPVLMPGGLGKRSFNLIKESEEKLHIILGRGKQGALTHEEIWHFVSYDGGISWSEQEIITNHPLMIFETLIDPYGNLHLVGIDFPDFSIWYSSMSPKTGQWNDLTKLDFANTAGWVSLTFDEAENELYLFWMSAEDPQKEVIYYSNKPVRSPY
jgi:hypothetical protein